MRERGPIRVEKRSGALLTAALLALGLALRIWWIDLSETGTRFLDLGEAARTAVALADRGVIADAFFPGQGPTAHLMPVMVVIAASVFRLFGSESAAASLILTGWALLQVFASYLLARRLFAAIGASRSVLAGGLAILCLLPAYVVQECADFRYWEGALATCLAMLNLLLIADLDTREDIAWQPLILAAALAAAVFFVSPTTGFAIGACWAWFALRRLDFARTLRFAGIAGAALALVVGPWMLRNHAVLGEPIALRSNFGLELAIANHPAAATAAPPLEVLRARMDAVHPYANPPGEARLRAAGGEIAYARRLGAETRAWIAAHPLDFLGLSLRHYRQFYVPERWQGALTNWPVWETERIDAIRFVSILGLIGLVVGLVRRRRHYGLIALYVAAAGLPYALVQPIPRYSYGLWALFAFLAAQLLADLMAAIARRLRRGASHPTSLR